MPGRSIRGFSLRPERKRKDNTTNQRGFLRHVQHFHEFSGQGKFRGFLARGLGGTQINHYPSLQPSRTEGRSIPKPVLRTLQPNSAYGRAHEIGRGEEAEQQIATVNGISPEQVRKMLQTAAIVWMVRNEHSWTQDLSWLRDRAGEYGLSREDVDEAEKLLPELGWKKP